MELNFEVENEGGERRRFRRFDTQREGQYFLKKERGRWERCTVINVSSGGIGIELEAGNELKVGSTIIVRAFFPGEASPAHIIGMVRWIRKKEKGCVGGIEASRALDDDNLYYSPSEI